MGHLAVLFEEAEHREDLPRSLLDLEALTFAQDAGDVLVETAARDVADAEASGLPYEMGLIKNKYIGRTFIQPTQELREKGVRMKLSAVRTIVRDKRVVLVDDSIVRGTTSRRIVTMLKEAGATEVHVRIASPAMISPCFYGVDTSTYDELISARKDLDGVREEIGADSLAFLSPESLLKAGNRSELCMACFTGRYPTALYQAVEQANKEGK